MGQEYNWEKILSNMMDEELFKILSDKREIKDKIEFAEKILLDKGIIKKDENGNYYRELIDTSLVNFTAYNLRNKTEEETEKELVKRGLNVPSAKRLIEFYNEWKIKQKKKGLIWKIITPFSIAVWLILEFMYDSPIALLFLIVPLFFIGQYAVSISNFKKIKIFKIIEETTPNSKS